MTNIEKFAISGEPFDVIHYFESFVLDTILRVFFSTEVDSANDSSNRLVINSRKITTKDISIKQFIAAFSPTIAKLFVFRFFDRNAADFMSKLIQKIIDERKKIILVENNFLQTLLDLTIDNQKSSKISEYLIYNYSLNLHYI